MKATEGADGTTFYIDRDSIKKEGKLLRVWELQDLKEKGPLDEKSRRVLVEYDCKDERRRVMSFSFHADQMGAGLTLKSDQTPGKWNLMVPNTTGSVVFQVASALKAPLKGAASLPPPPPPEPASEALGPDVENSGEQTKEEGQDVLANSNGVTEKK
jgi:hypothetical protein